MGLLDQFMNGVSNNSGGLLAAAAQMLQASGDPRRPFGLGQTAGLGMEAFQQHSEAARRRKLEEEQAAQAAEARALQMQSARGQLADQQDARQREQAIRSAFKSSMLSPELQAAQLAGGPTMANAGRISEMPGGLDQKRLVEQLMRIDPAYALKMQKDLAPAQEEFDTKPQVGIGPDGKPFTYLAGKRGTVKKLEDVLPRDPLKFLNLGGKTVGVNEFTGGQGAAFGHTMDPGESARLAQANRHHNDRLNFVRQQPRGQIIQTDQGPMLADPRAGTARPITGPDGQTLGPKMRSLPGQIQKAYLENEGALRKVSDALDAVSAYPQGLGLTNYLGDGIRQRTDPEGVKVRALVADIGSLKIHDRSGAAVTAAETPRLKPFIPAATDDPETVKKKLQLFQVEYQNIQQDIEESYSAENGYKAPSRPGGAPGVSNVVDFGSLK